MTLNLDEGDLGITGISLRLHFDSTKLTVDTLLNEGLVPYGYLGHYIGVDSVDLDADPATDRFVLVGWNDIDTNWPGSGGPPHFLLAARFQWVCCTPSTFRISTSSLPPGYSLDAPPIEMFIPEP